MNQENILSNLDLLVSESQGTILDFVVEPATESGNVGLI